MKKNVTRVLVGMIALILVVQVQFNTAKAQTISTFAGIGNGDGYQATSVGIGLGCFGDSRTATDKNGNVYFSSGAYVRKVSPNGILSTIAGIGSGGFSGDGGLAVNAEFTDVAGIFVDTTGIIYLADRGNNRVRKIDINGIISTIAGSGAVYYQSNNYGGDSGLATKALLSEPESVCLDKFGNIYIADYGNNRIRKIDPSGIITTVIGGGTKPFALGAIATEVPISHPKNVAVDSKGDVYFVNDGSTPNVGVVFRMLSSSGQIALVAGNGSSGGYSGDGGLATNAEFGFNLSLDIDKNDNIYIGDYDNNRIRKINNKGIVQTVAGNGTIGIGGEGLAANQCNITMSYWGFNVGIDGSGNFYFVEHDSQIAHLRKVNTNGIITTYAGNNSYFFNGDNIAANKALLFPVGIKADRQGNVVITDGDNNRIRKINTARIITTIAGNGKYGYTADNQLATNASFGYISGFALDKKGNIFICDGDYANIRKVSSNGILTTVAGVDTTYGGGYNGDTILAVKAQLKNPNSVAVDTIGNLYISDYGNNRIRKVNTKGIITTIAGTGIAGNSGSGGPAINALINQPSIVTTDNKGNVYFSDSSQTIRKIDKNGILTAIAGNGIYGYGGDGGLASKASFNGINDINVADDGTILVADVFNQRIRKIDVNGIITTVVGSGVQGFGGDGGSPTAAKLNYPSAVCLDSVGNLFIADAYNYRIRKVTGIVTPVTLASFTAKANETNTIQTIWQSATETNTSHFIIERSIEGKEFIAIGTVSAIGSGANTYHFTDHAPNNGINYYRLKMIDKDGSFSYSKVVSVQLSMVNCQLSISPNPAKEMVRLKINSDKSGKSILQFINNSGKVIKQQKIVFQAGANSLNIDISALTSGCYQVQLKTDNNLWQQRFIKE